MSAHSSAVFNFKILQYCCAMLLTVMVSKNLFQDVNLLEADIIMISEAAVSLHMLCKKREK